MKLTAELEQSLYRVSFTGAILAYLLFSHSSENALIFCTTYLIVGILSCLSILHHPQPMLRRQWLSLIMDLGAISVGFVLTGELGALFFGVYLWVIVGYGLRYGKSFLKAGVAVGIIFFLSAVQFNEYWTSHPAMVYGLILAMVLIPMHTQRLLNKLNIATEKAEAANKAKSNFISHISHEIRTPLNGITGASNLLMSTDDPSEQKHLAEIMQNSSELLVELVNNVLDLSKIENGKMELEHVNFNLNALVKNTVSIFESTAKQKNIKLSYQSDFDDSVNIHADFLHIKQVLINLIGNAIKFTKQGSVTLIISQGSHDKQNMGLKFEVVDTGIGIAEDVLPNIFESFNQANDTIKYEFGGTGLGTTICKELVSIMNGRLGVDSKLGKGSTFWFEVPVTTLQDDAAKEKTTNVVNLSDRIKRSIGADRILKILIADDNDTNLTILTKILEKTGHKVTTATNGDSVLDLLEDHQYDLLIIDKNMPEKSGVEVLKIYDALMINKKKVPSILLSADYITDEHMADAYLTKPINNETLFSTIKALTAEPRNQAKPAEVISYRSKGKDEVKTNGLLDTATLNNLALLDKDDGFMESLINNFTSDAEVTLKNLTTSVNQRDFLAMNHLGHTLAGSAKNVGAAKLGDLAFQFNEFVPYDDLDSIKSLLEETYNTYDLTKPALLSYSRKERVPSM
jgi:two-component system sensor histidine kinase RpfC